MPPRRNFSSWPSRPQRLRSQGMAPPSTAFLAAGSAITSYSRRWLLQLSMKETLPAQIPFFSLFLLQWYARCSATRIPPRKVSKVSPASPGYTASSVFRSTRRLQNRYGISATLNGLSPIHVPPASSSSAVSEPGLVSPDMEATASAGEESALEDENRPPSRRDRRRREEGAMGYSRKTFFKKMRNPRASKPWRNQHGAVATGAISVTAQSDVLVQDERGALPGTASASEGEEKRLLMHMGHLTTGGVMGMRSPHVPPSAAMEGLARSVPRDFRADGQLHGGFTGLGSSFGSSSSFATPLSPSDTLPLHSTENREPSPLSTHGKEEEEQQGSTTSSLAAPKGQSDAGTAMGPAWATAALYPPEIGSARPYLPTAPFLPSEESREGLQRSQTRPLASVPLGKALDFQVDHVETYDEPVPVGLQQYARQESLDAMEAGAERKGGPKEEPLRKEARLATKRELANAIRLPRHLNKLFHKIMGWSDELVEVEREKQAFPLAHHDRDGDHEQGSATPLQTAEELYSEERAGEETFRSRKPSTPTETDGEPHRAVRQKMSQLTDRMKYGVLLADYEKDQFALEHRITVAGRKMERKFLQWEGLTTLDQDHTEAMPFLKEHKAALVMQSPSSARVPVVNQDCCGGCGALLQNQNPDALGYVAPGEVERFLLERDQRAEAREAYGQRMAELQQHWEKHGRQVGEEWLDFMTQEEFDAFYRDRRAPFVCRRCHALENLGVEGRRKVWSAPDFTEKLKALREKRCVVVLVIDITDFPGSMVFDLPGLISMNNPVIIAVNKMDCVRNRSFQYANKDRAVSAALVSPRYIRQWVMDIALSFKLPKHQIKAVVPVSAKRGWKMEELLSTIEDAANLNLRRPHKPLPTYFVGAANVGKSSLINALAHHLYVPQPPHPESKKVYYMRVDPKTGEERVWWRWYTPPNVNRAEMYDIPSRHDKKASKLLTVSSLPGTTVAVNAVQLSLRGYSSKHNTDQAARGEGGESARATSFFFDTPGVVPHWHRDSPLTLHQMRRLLMRKFRHPECYVLVPGNTLLLAGLAAIDVVKGCPTGMLFMVYTSQKAHHAIVQTPDADDYWRQNLGKRIGPPDSYEQIASLYGNLEAAGYNTDDRQDGEDSSPKRRHRPTSSLLSESRSYVFECYERHRRRPVADVYVCGLGWVSFCVRDPADVVLRVRTLPGVVHGVRRPLRYNDLRPYRFWPRLRRAATTYGIDKKHQEKLHRKSIATVVKLVAGAQAGNASDIHNSVDGATPSANTTTSKQRASERVGAPHASPESSSFSTGSRILHDNANANHLGSPGSNAGETSSPERRLRHPLPDSLRDAHVEVVEKTPHAHHEYQPGSADPMAQLLDELHSL